MVSGSAIVNGVLSDLSEARLPIIDRGFLFGQAVFETVLVRKGVLVNWVDHIERLRFGCKQSLIAFPDAEILLAWAKDCVADLITRSGQCAEKMQLRMIVTGGSSPVFFERDTPSLSANIVMFCRIISGVSPEVYARGLRLSLMPDPRSFESVHVKSVNYLQSLIAFERGLAQGCDDVLYFNVEHMITESSTASFVWIDSNGVFHSAPGDAGCLPGTTLRALLRVLEREQLSFSFAALPVAQLHEVSGCFIISSTRGLVPVREIISVESSASLVPATTVFDLSKVRMLWEKIDRLLD